MIKTPVLPTPQIEFGKSGIMHLHGLIVHRERSEKGHYVTIRRKGLDWYIVDDKAVVSTTFHEVLNEPGGAMFLYSRQPSN